MEREEHIKYWLESAKQDLEVAETLFQNRKYAWSLFILHLVLEKTIKAHYVKRHNELPPKIHNLVRLCEAAELEITEEQKIFLDEVNDFNLEIRYPDYKFEFYKKCDENFTKDYFDKIKEFYEWLLSQIE